MTIASHCFTMSNCKGLPDQRTNERLDRGRSETVELQILPPFKRFFDFLLTLLRAEMLLMPFNAAITLLLALFAALQQCSSAETTKEKSREGSTFECYTCLGRDYDNCIFGQTRCAGACWKMIDEKHELIAKGCTAEDKSDNEQESGVDTRVKLPWSPNGAETIQGAVYYCKGDWCNGADQSTQTKLIAFLMILFGFVGRLALADYP
ncbi:hypothetical protein M514_10455 [Trichuris suis]|uniref:Uncharacterized protein n=1 Tax=Trichuris suis TaxID=68888 RepID=A0A085NMI1_9BILA|nr:hypothetical protein M514_10455 [Trichuris suis]